MVCQSHETGTEKEDESLSDSKALSLSSLFLNLGNVIVLHVCCCPE